jgi:hypothetical protein
MLFYFSVSIKVFSDETFRQKQNFAAIVMDYLYEILFNGRP